MVYLSNFLRGLGFESFKTILVNGHSTGTMSVTANRSYRSRTMYAFFIRELVKSSKITIRHVPTGAMPADTESAQVCPTARS